MDKNVARLFLLVLGWGLLCILNDRIETMVDCKSELGKTCTPQQQEQLQGLLNVIESDIKGKQTKYNQDTYIDGKKVATPDDVTKSNAYALSKMCELKGYVFNSDGGGYCMHTQRTCARDSKETGDDYDLQYLEWRGDEDDVGRCVYAFSGFKKRCIKDGLTYTETSGKCEPNKQYCECKGVEFKNGDCWQDPVAIGVKSVLGSTITQGFNREVSGKGVKHGCTAWNDDAFLASTSGLGLGIKKAVQAGQGKDTSIQMGKKSSMLRKSYTSPDE